MTRHADVPARDGTGRAGSAGGGTASCTQPHELIPADRIAARVGELAEGISKSFGAEPLVLVGVLTGAYVFVADLSRRLGVPHEVAFVRARSYGSSTTPTDDVALDGLDDVNLRDRHVLVVEDLVDTGHTLQVVRDAILAGGAASVATCALVVKDRPRTYDVPIDFVGFEVPDVWVVGYGIDCRGSWRHLSWLGYLEVDA